MTAQQQEPTMREEIIDALYAQNPLYYEDAADVILAVLERRGDDDAARVRRVAKLADELDARRDPSYRFADAARRIRRALDGDDTDEVQEPPSTSDQLRDLIAENRQLRESTARVVAYIRRRAEDYRLSSPQSCSSIYSLAREIEGDPGVTPRFDPRGDDTETGRGQPRNTSG